MRALPVGHVLLSKDLNGGMTSPPKAPARRRVEVPAEQDGARLDAFLTADQQLKHQQNLTGRQLAILVLSTNRWPKLKAKTAEIIAAIQALRPGDYVELTL